MPAPHPLIFHVFPGDPTRGVWCPDCLLPSAYTVPMFLVTMSGVRSVGSATACDSCKRLTRGT